LSVDTPSPAKRLVLSIWLCFHLFAILISFTYVVEPSTIHARLSGWAYPYLRSTHFSADDRPVYLAHGDPSERPHRVQITNDLVSDIELVDTYRWRTVGPDVTPGLAASDRVARWLSTAAMVAGNDDPGLVAELMLPIIEQNSDATALRILRLTTDLGDIGEADESIYVARVIRRGNEVSLVRLEAARLSARAAEPTTNRPEESSDE
jgi:hypothetical protein